MIPRLMPWSSSPAARRHQQHEQVDHVGHRELGLAHADRLDEHDVEAGRLAQQHRLAGAAGDAAERAAAGDGRMNARAPEPSMRVLSPRIEPPDACARRVDREHRDPVARPR